MKKARKSGIRFAMCIKNHGYESSLEIGKLYRVIPDQQAKRHGYLRVVDESGEDYGYAANRFFDIEVPKQLENMLLKRTAACRLLMPCVEEIDMPKTLPAEERRRLAHARRTAADHTLHTSPRHATARSTIWFKWLAPVAFTGALLAAGYAALAPVEFHPMTLTDLLLPRR